MSSEVKQMNAVEALRFMAAKWREPIINARGDACVCTISYGDFRCGICGCLLDLEDAELVDSSTTNFILQLIDMAPFHDAAKNNYKWPRDLAGAAMRAAWCEETADRLERESQRINGVDLGEPVG